MVAKRKAVTAATVRRDFRFFFIAVKVIAGTVPNERRPAVGGTGLNHPGFSLLNQIICNAGVGKLHGFGESTNRMLGSRFHSSHHVTDYGY